MVRKKKRDTDTIGGSLAFLGIVLSIIASLLPRPEFDGIILSALVIGFILMVIGAGIIIFGKRKR